MFNLLLGLFKSNYVRIAENTAKYYLELTRNYSDSFTDEISLLATAGVLDAQVYIFTERSIELETILAMSRAAISSEEISFDISTYEAVAMQQRLRKYNRKRSAGAALEFLLDDKTSLQEDSLFKFVFSLEVEIFSVDSPNFLRSDIEWSCYTKANTISKAIRKMKQEYMGETLFHRATNAFMESPDFKLTRKQIGIK